METKPQLEGMKYLGKAVYIYNANVCGIRSASLLKTVSFNDL